MQDATPHPTDHLTRIVLAVAGLLFVAPADAQTVVGRAMDEGAGTPVDAVLVELLSADSTRVRATLTANGGLYSLALDGPGTYAIQFVRFGYATMVAGPLEISGDTVVNVTLTAEPVSLAPIRATREGRCSVRPEQGVATARLWEQIRKVLAVTDVVSQEGLLEFELVRFERDLDVSRSRQRSESMLHWVGSDPFLGYSGEMLTREGFVEPADSAQIYWHMPVPEVILSDAFLNAHCFSVHERMDGDRRLLGLGFEPLDSDRDRPDRDIRNANFEELLRDDRADVLGTLWVDGSTGALEALEYGYTGIRSEELRALAGGYARFEQLTDGKWVVRQWWIRVPLIVGDWVRGRLRRLRAAGIRETGGELLQASVSGGEAVTRRTGQRVWGRLIPSDIGIPLDSTTLIRMSGTAYVTTVDSTGGFEFPDVSPGRYLATFHHPRLDTLGINRPVSSFNVSRDPVELVLTVPTLREAISSVCPGQDEDSDRGIILVAVRDAGGDPVANQTVRLRSPGQNSDIRESTTLEGGLVRFCEVPPDEPLVLLLPGHDDVRVSVSVEPRGFVRRDIEAG